MDVNASGIGTNTSSTIQPLKTIQEDITQSDRTSQKASSANQLTLSNLGKSVSQLDALHTEHEKFIESKIPTDVLNAIDSMQEELDGMMEQGISENSEQFKALSNKLDQEISKAETYFSKEDLDYLDKLENQIEELEFGIEAAFEAEESGFGEGNELAYSAESQDKRALLLSLLEGTNNSKKGNQTLTQSLQSLTQKVTG